MEEQPVSPSKHFFLAISLLHSGALSASGACLMGEGEDGPDTSSVSLLSLSFFHVSMALGPP